MKLWPLKLLFLCLGVAAALLYAKIQQVLQTPHQIEGEQVLQIKNGASLLQIAELLQQKKLVEHKIYFILYCKINNIFPKVKAGEYLIEHVVTLPELAQILTSGKVYYRKITFAEGLTAREMAEILYANEYLSGDYNDFAEGELLPETYAFSRGDDRQKIVNQAKKAKDDVLQQAWNERDADLPLNNKQEMLILASIVEKETGLAAERPQVASVFINRLRKGMLLQTDPTVIYALTEGKSELNRPLTRKDLQIDSPYNTYKYAGLPPAPICSPGKEAIMAVAHPDKTPYLYFVASGNGGHNFAVTLSEHNANVNKWRQRH